MLGVLQVFFQRAGSSGGAGCVERLAAAPCVAVHSGTKGGGRSLHPRPLHPLHLDLHPQGLAVRLSKWT